MLATLIDPPRDVGRYCQVNTRRAKRPTTAKGLPDERVACCDRCGRDRVAGLAEQLAELLEAYFLDVHRVPESEDGAPVLFRHRPVGAGNAFGCAISSVGCSIDVSNGGGRVEVGVFAVRWPLMKNGSGCLADRDGVVRWVVAGRHSKAFPVRRRRRPGGRWYRARRSCQLSRSEGNVQSVGAVDHVRVYRWVQCFTPLLADAARSCRHAVGDRWFVDGRSGSPVAPQVGPSNSTTDHRRVRVAGEGRRFFQ